MLLAITLGGLHRTIDAIGAVNRAHLPAGAKGLNKNIHGKLDSL